MIVVRQGAGPPERFEKARVTIGSSPASDLRLEAPGVAADHAEVFLEDAWLLLRDSGSPGGTFVNGARLGTTPWPIATGDRVRLGVSGPELELATEGATRETALRALWGATIGGDETVDPDLTLRGDARDFRATKTVEATLSGLVAISPAGTTVPPPAAAAGASAPAPSPASYELLSELGRGGMGVVYRARQPGLAREVAIKKILPVQDREDTRARFVSEALTTGFLDHPNVVPVHELRAEGGEILLSMKLVGGVSWKDLLHPRKPEHEALAKKHDRDSHLAILLAACNAVAFAHSKGIVHRDLKPENVMVGEFGEVLVMDWGIAVSFGDERDTRAPHRSTVLTPSGTPAYMAPEMAEGEGEKLGPATDVFLLGAILHEVLTGRPPHSGGSVYAVLLAATRAEPPQFGPGVPRELGAICAKALARDPGARHGSVVELQEAIRSYQEHRESTKISDAAGATLARCEAGGAGLGRDRRYAELSRALAGFEQALVLWSESGDARDGERRARLAYASAALGHGDLGLAETLVAGMAKDDADRVRIVTAARTTRDEIASRERRSRWMRRGLVVSLAAILVGGGVSYVLIREQRDEAIRARDGERAAKEVAQLEAYRGKVGLAERDYAKFLEFKDNPTSSSWDPEGLLIAAAKVTSAALAALRARPDSVAPETSSVVQDLDRRIQEIGWSSEVATLSYANRYEPRTIGTPLGTPRCVAFSPDRRVVLAGIDHLLVLWDLETGSPMRVLVDTARVNACAFSGDGKEILSASADATLELWDRESGRLRRTFARHAGEVRACAFSPSGNEVLSASDDKTLRLWDKESGRLLRTFEGHEGAVTGCAFSPDGKEVLSASEDRTLRLWDEESGKLLRTFEGHTNGVVACAFSPGGREILSASNDETLDLWDRESGKLLRTFEGHASGVVACAFSPDGNEIVSASSNGMLRLWDRASGRALRALEGHTSFVEACALSPDGKEILSASADETLKLWDRESGRLLRTLAGHTGLVMACAFSPDGKEILSGSSDTTLELWDRESGKLLRTLAGHGYGVVACAFSPDGKEVLSAPGGKTLELWDRESGKLLRTFAGHGDAVMSCAFSPDGKAVLSASKDKTLKLWDEESGRLVRTFEGHTAWVAACAFSPGGKEILSASGDATLKLWDRESGKLLHTFEGHRQAVSRCAFSPDGKEILSVSEDRTLRLWDRQSGETVGTLGCGWVGGCAFSPDGRQVVYVADGRTFRVWDPGSGKVLRTFESHADWIASCAFSPDGKVIVSGTGDKTLELWDRERGSLLRTLEGHTSRVGACAFSPDGKEILSASDDRTLELWDAASGKPVRAFEGHGGPVRGCAFSPDGKEIVSASKDRTLRLWDRRSGKLLRTFEGHADAVAACAFSPGGEEILSASDDKTLKLWERASGRLLRTFQARTGWGREPACAFSPDGKEVLAAFDDKALGLWSKETGKLLRTFEGRHVGSSCAFSPDGKVILAASLDATVTLWDAASGMVLRAIHGDTADACAFSPGGQEILSASGRTLTLRDRGPCFGFAEALPGFEDDPVGVARRAELNLRLDGRPTPPALDELPRLVPVGR